jgi:PLP dependent protein
MSFIESNLRSVQQSVLSACQQSNRTVDSVTLVAVSKTYSADCLLEAYLAGQKDFGENYLQEALDKQIQLAQLLKNTDRASSTEQPIWHFIGGIQSNKTKAIAENFDVVHTVDRPIIAKRLSDARPSYLPDLQIYLQVNTSNEASKGGVHPDELLELATSIKALPRLKLLGLMTIPEPTTVLEEQRAAFRELKRLGGLCEHHGVPIAGYSMGMSQDYPMAIAEGSTCVRVGSAIFGIRGS